ncbi:hypothetical protein LTR78_004692 [Recurvomyces mirabilis]|uniref:Uncharacterized protein n=1 Tax=Recurvomyces mirabilis TaxID=574656 RepID=A0AAE1C2L2_9PEZI|nr:hypothetical protein LTR78_004692 [Recurvomyces mirabilis]
MSDSQDIMLVDEIPEDDANVLGKDLAKLEISVTQTANPDQTSVSKIFRLIPPQRKPRTGSRKKRIEAIFELFDARYGRDEHNLAAWKILCNDLDFEEGQTITQCKNNLELVHVNVYEFYFSQIDFTQECRRFGIEEELRGSSNENDLFCLLRRAKNNPLLKWLQKWMLIKM